MSRRIVVVLLALIFLAAFAASQSPKVEIPVLSTTPDEVGARPGTFHFITNEQTMSNMAEMKKAFAALDSLDQQIAQLPPDLRKKLLPDLQQLRTFTTQVHTQSSASAGKTASEIEARLNEAKGKFMCGACHGHGMMHGRGMRSMSPGN